MDRGSAAPHGAATNGRPTRERLLGAMLEESGERGFAQVSRQDVERRAGASRGAFGDRFAGKEECFALAYREAAARLSQRMLPAGREGSFRQGLSAAMREALAHLAGRPALARALLIEVNGAGEAALEEQRRAIGRLAVALDRAARAKGGAEGGPAITASFVAGGMASLVRSRVARGEVAELPGLEAELVELAMLQFFPADTVAGESAAVF